VHEGRLYVFASEPCRAGFLKAPEKLLDRDDPLPEASPETSRRGAELLARALASVGGAERVDRLRAIERRDVHAEESGGATYRVAHSLLLAFPDGVREETSWNDAGWSHTVTERDAFSDSSDGEPATLHPQQARALRRATSHEILGLLRARARSDLRALALPADPRLGPDVERLLVHYDGTATELRLGAADGSLRGLAFRGRGPSMRIGRVELTIGERATVGGLSLPTAWSATFDGEPAPSLSVSGIEYLLDPELAPLAR
jgi:hypothetical protein